VKITVTKRHYDIAKLALEMDKGPCLLEAALIKEYPSVSVGWASVWLRGHGDGTLDRTHVLSKSGEQLVHDFMHDRLERTTLPRTIIARAV